LKWWYSYIEFAWQLWWEREESGRIQREIQVAERERAIIGYTGGNNICVNIRRVAKRRVKQFISRPYPRPREELVILS
jgi:hypothetical protein